MAFEKEDERIGCRILQVFCSGRCARKRLCPETADRGRLILEAADTGFSEDIVLRVEFIKGIWLIEGKALRENGPVYLNTKEEERLLLLCSGELESLASAGSIVPREGERLVIGNEYKNRIFYKCFSLVQESHAEIAYIDGGFQVCRLGDGEVYVNGRRLKEKQDLKSGDWVDVYGLHILVLRGLLVCVCFCGVCRIAIYSAAGIARQNTAMQTPTMQAIAMQTADHRGMKTAVGMDSAGRKDKHPAIVSPEKAEQWIERRRGQEEALHTGEIEVALPERRTSEPREPLFLSLGPTLTMVFPVLLMAQLSNRFLEGAGKGFYYMSVAMSGSSAVIALFWGLAGYGYKKRSGKREAREKERQYMEYLEGLEAYLRQCGKENREILERRYPPASAFLEEKERRVTVLWNRYYRQKDFLYLRVGKGKVPFQIRLKLSGGQKNILQEKLGERAGELVKKYTYLEDIPVEADLYENRQIGITGEKAGEVLMQLLVQIMACHCYTEVKTACFFEEEKAGDREIAESLKWMPHSWSADRKMRLIAGNEKEAAAILPVLTKELKRGREQQTEGLQIPWYIVIVLREELIFGEPLYKYLTDPEGKYPVSAVFLGKEREDLPKSCRYFIRKDRAEGEILNLGREQIFRQQIMAETCDSLGAQVYVRKAAGFRVREEESGGQLPEQVGFLQLYDCSRVEDVQSGRRWRLARPEERLKAPLGRRAGGHMVSLDLHEKFHGPHGLIAGTTGSGKSELLQTYLLSMAVSFSPSDVNFFMIDYKGGGTGNALSSLPHCAGVISNLSGNQIKRAMSAITSENKRRQQLFGRYQVNHIDAYTRLCREGKGEGPMPHLILVIDEFAELKKEEPEFMQEIISLAQVGRSLGVHLILATQKPAGTVDDKIWSNARFRLCLRVQDKQDSMDMLHNGDAAFLTAPGQCYLQIGNHEYYELFQAGYCGGAYVEEGEENVRAALVENTGKRLKSTGKRPEKTDIYEERQVSLIEALVNYVNHTALKMGYERAKALWLPELPGEILLDALLDKDKMDKGKLKQDEIDKDKLDKDEIGVGEETEIILGLYDDPENQRQDILSYCPCLQGHLAICGGPATGKTTLLATILWQLSTCDFADEAIFMVVDMGQGGLESFRAMPNCLGVLRRKEEMNIFFYHLERLMERRQKELAGISINQYGRSGEEKLPLVFLVVDNFGDFRKILEEKQEELLMKLASQGLSLGIYLILSAAGAGEIGTRLFDKIKTTLALEMSDRFQYGDVLRQYYLSVLPKENQKGRGLCRVQERVLEFQGAILLKAGDGDYGRLAEETGRKRKEEFTGEGKPLPKKFPVVPEKAEYERLAEEFHWEKGNLPLGYSLLSGEICVLSLERTNCFLISGTERTGRAALLRCLMESALHLQNNVVVLDTGRRYQDLQNRMGITVLTADEEIEKWQMRFMESFTESCIEENREPQTCVFISDMGDFCRFLYGMGEMREERIRFWEQTAMGKGKIAFLAGIYHPAKDYEAAGTGFFREFTSWQQGIHLGGNAAAQRALLFDDLSYTDQNRHEPAGIGYWKDGMGKETLRVLLPRFCVQGQQRKEGQQV